MKKRTRGLTARTGPRSRRYYGSKGVQLPRGLSPRAFKRREQRTRYTPESFVAVGKPNGNGTSKRELIAFARVELGRPTMGWKATKKYERKLKLAERRAADVAQRDITYTNGRGRPKSKLARFVGAVKRTFKRKPF